jgi:flagellar biosynthesis regulator FlbT
VFHIFKVVWDPRIILNFSLVHHVDRKVVMELLEDKKYLGREDYNVPIFRLS